MMMLWDGKTYTINAYECVEVSAIAKPQDQFMVHGRIILHGNARAELHGNARAELHGNARAALYDDSHTVLYDDSRAVLYGDSRATFYDDSRAVLHGASHAVLYGNARAELHGASRAVLHDDSRAVLYSDSRVVLYGNARATLYGCTAAWVYAKAKAEKMSRIAAVIKPKPLGFFEREGVAIKNKNVLLYKRVSCDFKTQEGKSNETLWLPGTTVTSKDWRPKGAECGPGKFHAVSRPCHGDIYRSTDGDKYIAIRVNVKDLYEWKNPDYLHKIAFRKGKVLYECDYWGFEVCAPKLKPNPERQHKKDFV